jgi:hypothetical protein
MNTNTLNLKYSGRRKLNPSRKRTMFIYGIILIFIGLLGLYIFGFDLKHLFWHILAIGGVLNVIHSLFGKELIKEVNRLSINSNQIEYKNSFRKPQIIKIENLLDLRIETAKVEFVQNGQRVESYNFSVFQRQELDTIYQELERIKLYLVK